MEQHAAGPAAASGQPSIELGAWLGRGQAFTLIAHQCSAAQAECLKRIREQGAYKLLGLTWEDFCPQHLGLSRSRADQLIRQLDQFGAAYFRLAEIMQISEGSYRRIAGAVHNDCIEVDGELLPIAPENAPRIKRAVLELRRESEHARAELARAQAVHPTITALKIRLDACFQEMSAMASGPLDPGEDAALRGLIRYSLGKLKRLLRSLDQRVS
jgi:hypothetical protein